MPSDRTLRVGLIGSGFMGRAHAFGYGAAQKAFDLGARIELHTLADATEAVAATGARALGFDRSTSDWRAMVADPAIDVVHVTAPNALHKEMALAAIAHGKHVHCEKPLAPRAADAAEMRDAARAAGVVTQVGFNYLCNPMLLLARDMIAAGEIGEVRSYRGVHAEDYMADAEGAWTFRHDPAGGGALADLGSHALTTAEFLLGPIARVMGDLATAIPERPDGRGGRRAVEVDDVARAFPAVRVGGDRVAGGVLDRHRAHDAARLRGLRQRGRARLHAGAAQRAARLLHPGSEGAPGLSPHRGRARPPALRRLLRGAGPPARLQRPQGHRDGGLRGGDRHRRPRALRLRRGRPRPGPRGGGAGLVAGRMRWVDVGRGAVEAGRRS